LIFFSPIVFELYIATYSVNITLKTVFCLSFLNIKLCYVYLIITSTVCGATKRIELNRFSLSRVSVFVSN